MSSVRATSNGRCKGGFAMNMLKPVLDFMQSRGGREAFVKDDKYIYERDFAVRRYQLLEAVRASVKATLVEPMRFTVWRM